MNSREPRQSHYNRTLSSSHGFDGTPRLGANVSVRQSNRGEHAIKYIYVITKNSISRVWGPYSRRLEPRFQKYFYRRFLPSISSFICNYLHKKTFIEINKAQKNKKDLYKFIYLNLCNKNNKLI